MLSGVGGESVNDPWWPYQASRCKEVPLLDAPHNGSILATGVNPVSMCPLSIAECKGMHASRHVPIYANVGNPIVEEGATADTQVSQESDSVDLVAFPQVAGVSRVRTVVSVDVQGWLAR